MKQIIKTSHIILLVSIIMIFCFRNSISQVTDYDGGVYKTVIIGNQEWMAENLKVEHYRNGDVIPQAQDKDEWKNLKTGAWCHYENKTSNGKNYGKLYNWYAVNDSRGIAPEGWHIPSDGEWKILMDNLGEDVAGKMLKSISGWYENGNGTNSSGFSALPGGIRNYKGSFDEVGMFAYFWTTSEISKNLAWENFLNYGSSMMNSGNRLSREDKCCGLSVRCVKD